MGVEHKIKEAELWGRGNLGTVTSWMEAGVSPFRSPGHSQRLRGIISPLIPPHMAARFQFPKV